MSDLSIAEPLASTWTTAFRGTLCRLASDASQTIFLIIVLQALVYPFVERAFTSAEVAVAFAGYTAVSAAGRIWRRYRAWTAGRHACVQSSQGPT